MEPNQNIFKSQFESEKENIKLQDELNYSLRKLKRETEKKERVQKIREYYLNPPLKNGKIIWIPLNENGTLYHGIFEKKIIFIIKKKFLFYELTNDGINNINKIRKSSLELLKLKENAEKIIKNKTK